MKNFLFLDLETTGLNPLTDEILEVAVIAIQLKEDGTIEEGGSYSTVISPKYKHPFFNWEQELNPRVLKMHTDNGLLEDIDKLIDSRYIQDADKIVNDFIDENFGTGANRIELAGSSVHFDLEFVREHMPRTAKRLSYRVMDVTPYRTARNTLYTVTEPKSVAHRALDDIKYSLSVFKEMTQVLLESLLLKETHND